MKVMKKIAVDRILRSTWGNDGDFAWEFQHTDFDGIEAVKSFVEMFLVMTQKRGEIEEWQEYLKDKQGLYRNWWKRVESKKQFGSVKVKGKKRDYWLPPMSGPPTRGELLSVLPVQDNDMVEELDQPLPLPPPPPRSFEGRIDVLVQAFDSCFASGKFERAWDVGISPAYGISGPNEAFSMPVLQQAIKSNRFYYFGDVDILLHVVHADFWSGMAIANLGKCNHCRKVFRRQGRQQKGGKPSKYCNKNCSDLAYYYRSKKKKGISS